MTGFRSKHVGFTLRHVLAILIVIASCGTTARADVVALDNTLGPIVRIAIKSGDVTVRTWNRPRVEIDGDPTLSVVRRTVRRGGDVESVLIPHAQIATRDGLSSLPAESFVVSTIPAGPHDLIVVRSGDLTPSGPVVVTIPSDAAFVFVFARDGNLDVRGYRAGTLIAFTTHGRLALDDIGGTVFAQSNRGAIRVSDSTIDRVRVRSLVGNISFERAHTRQIEATSVGGSIVYDNGTFEPGLAHFESTRGDVAIGTSDAAQLGGHVGNDGHVYTNFERAAHVTGGDGERQAIVGGGGPVVTATTQSGNVFLYDGSIRGRERLAPEWHAPIRTLTRAASPRAVPAKPANASHPPFGFPHVAPRRRFR